MKITMAFPFALKTMRLTAALALVSLCLDASATTSSSNLNITAVVTPSCSISTSPISFGAYDPVSLNQSNPLDGSGSVVVTCSNGTNATVTLGQGLTPATESSDASPLRQMASGENTLQYALYQDSNRSQLWGNTAGTGTAVSATGSAQTLTVFGRVPGGQNVPTGNYADVVTATVTF